MLSMFETLEDRTFLSHHAPAVTNVLSVSSNSRYLVQSDGTPFFYMSDTAWNLFDRTTIKQADLYLQTRAAEGFTVVQAEINARLGADVYGDAPFINSNPARPNE